MLRILRRLKREQKKSQSSFRSPRRGSRGFTLIEMLVSVALFSVVMLTAGATLLSLVYANRKAQAIQSTMNNLNIALDGMVRAIRSGTNYHCGSPPSSSPRDCSSGDVAIYFAPYGDATPGNPATYWGYIYDPTTHSIYKTVSGDSNIADDVQIIAPEVTITNMQIYVVGTTPNGSDANHQQPKVVVTLSGNAGVQGETTRTTFNIQATAVQRELDL